MTSRAMLQEYEVLVNAPNGVQSLREIILQLAVRGKLLPQDASDEPASALLQRIRASRSRSSLARGAGISPSFPEADVPFDTPDGWEWLLLGEAGRFLGGGTPSKANPSLWVGDIPWVSPKDMKSFMISDSADHISAAALAQSAVRLIPEGSLLMVVRGMILARTFPVALAAREVTVNQDMKALELYDPRLGEFLLLALRAWKSRVLRRVERSTHGTCRLSSSVLEELLLPIPPLAEQERIVARVDELMALCDKLEAREQRRATLRARLNRSVLHHLTLASEGAELGSHWQRLRENFHLLYDTPDTVPELRRAVLQLAVRGKLVPQDPTDEPASALLERRSTEMEQRLGGRGTGSRPIALHVDDNEEPFTLPNGWQWARFTDVASIASNLVSPMDHRNEPHIAPDNIEKGTGRLLAFRSVEADNVRSSNHRFFAGQILYSKIRPNLSKATLVDFGGLCSADMYPIDAYIFPNYLLDYILSPTFLKMAVKSDTRVAMPKINQAELSKVLVPVPPLAEQRRIAARVDELVGLCDVLMAQVARARETCAHLAASVVHRVTAAGAADGPAY